MTRPSPSQARALWIGLAMTLAGTLVTAATRQFADSKLDAVRFERDSITTVYELSALRGDIARVDSTTRRIEAKLDRIEARR